MEVEHKTGGRTDGPIDGQTRRQIIKYVHPSALDAMEEMVEDEYVGDLQSTTSHSVTLSDGSVVELRENGSQQPVLVHERQAYADAVRKVRMTECEEQVSQ